MQRSLQNDSDSCTQDPFLWYIRRSSKTNDANNDSNEDILGFAIGTMHLDPETVLAEQAWTSLRNALDDSCAVYAELDITSLSIMTQLTECVEDIQNAGAGDLVTLDQLPDRDRALREAYVNKLRAYVAVAYSETPLLQLAILDYLVTSVSILQILDLVATFNTQTSLSDNSTTTTTTTVLDEELLLLGRSSGSIETVETQCKVVELLWSLNPTDFWDHYEEYWKSELEKGLDVSLDDTIDAYRCGDADRVEEILNESYTASTYRKDSFEFVFTERNIQMANFIADVLDEQGAAARKSVFAVGLGHWLPSGNYNDKDNSMIQLLADRGYVLERVEGLYDPNFQPDASDQTCESTDSPTPVDTNESNLTLDFIDETQTVEQTPDAEMDKDENHFDSSSACRRSSFVTAILLLLFVTTILLCECVEALSLN